MSSTTSSSVAPKPSAANNNELPRKLRSIIDFDTDRDLRCALRDKNKHSSLDIRRGYDLDDADAQEDNNEYDQVPMDKLDVELDWIQQNIEQETSQIQSLEDELTRLKVLRSYMILDAERDESFERLMALAARLFDVPIALISLVDLGRLWFACNRGLGDVRQIPRKASFCAHAILTTLDLFIVPDLTKDWRFRNNPLVTGPANFRFYGAALLVAPEGVRIGTLCVMDTKPHPGDLSLTEKQNLRELAALAVDAMVTRRQKKRRLLQDDKAKLMACAAHDLLTHLSAIQLNLSLLLEDHRLCKSFNMTQRERVDMVGTCCRLITRICCDSLSSFQGEAKDRQRMDSGKLRVKRSCKYIRQTINVADLIKSVSRIMALFPKAVPLYITVNPAVPEQIVSDELKILRSVINLLTNACKVTEKGFIHQKLFIKDQKQRHRWSRSKSMLIFECEDTGPGIPIEAHLALFHPFRDDCDLVEVDSCGSDDQVVRQIFNSSGACLVNTHASGLGLCSVADNISSLGGEYGCRPRTLDCQASGGEGNTTGAVFWFSVPLLLPTDATRARTVSDTVMDGCSVKIPPTEQRGAVNQEGVGQGSQYNSILDVLSPQQAGNSVTSAPVPKDGIEKLPITLKRQRTKMEGVEQEVCEEGKVSRMKRALVIDDSIVVRKSLSQALTNTGFAVKQAKDGMEGLKELQSNVFDVVLCDFLMPVMDGMDCVRQYRSWEESHRPWFRQHIIGISAHASALDVEQGIKSGMNSFLSKPLSLDVIKHFDSDEDIGQNSKALDRVLDIDIQDP